MRILVVDDEPAVRASLERALSLDGYEVEVARDGHEGLARLREHVPDAVVLDLLMPSMDGLELCRALRARGDRTPVLMLTARHALGDRVAGLDAGADDYLVKPFDLDELLARLRALLRRAGGADALAWGTVTMDLGTREVRRGDRELDLTYTEFELLRAFLEHPRQVLSRSALLERVWGYDFSGSSNTLEVYVGYLRRKLESGGEPRILQTVRGVGYSLRDR